MQFGNFVGSCFGHSGGGIKRMLESWRHGIKDLRR